jgi:ribosome assembly protein YihI (activator of Der GTPase)
MSPVDTLKDSFEKIAIILSQLKEDPDLPLLPNLNSCYDRLTLLIKELDDTNIQSDETQHSIYQILKDLEPLMDILNIYKEKYAEDTKNTENRYQAFQSYKRYKM